MIIVAILGATSEVATLKQALVEAEKRAASERTEREKYETEVGKVRQELQALMENMRVWSLTQRYERPSSRWLLKMPSLPRPNIRRPSRSWMR